MNNSIREIGENIKNSRFFDGTIRFDEPMSLHTTMKVGGKAALYVEPADVYSAATVFSCCAQQEIAVFTLGGGSNLVVSDNGFDGAVVSLRKMNRIDIASAGEIDGDASLLKGTGAEVVTGANPCAVVVHCGAGTKMNDIAAYCAKFGITGLESFAGLPGTVGGAAYMNARCYEKNVSDVFDSAEYIDLSGLTTGNSKVERKTYVMNKDDWDYKHSPFMEKKMLVTQVAFKGICLDKRVLDGYSAADPVIQQFVRARNDHFVQDRIAKGHFKAPSAGSVFKNNHNFGKPSGQLIDEAGLKGTAIGGAQIAPWHGNFIINTGRATAADIHALVVLVQDTVKKQTGFLLEPEIIFCGNGYEN